jgi:hypothetical protein
MTMIPAQIISAILTLEYVPIRQSAMTTIHAQRISVPAPGLRAILKNRAYANILQSTVLMNFTALRINANPCRDVFIHRRHARKIL